MRATTLGRPDVIPIFDRAGNVEEEWEVCTLCQDRGASDAIEPCPDCRLMYHPHHLHHETMRCAGCTRDAAVMGEEEAAIPVNATPWVVVCAPGLALSWCQRCDAYLGRPTRVISARVFLSVLARFMREHRHCTEAE